MPMHSVLCVLCDALPFHTQELPEVPQTGKLQTNKEIQFWMVLECTLQKLFRNDGGDDVTVWYKENTCYHAAPRTSIMRCSHESLVTRVNK